LGILRRSLWTNLGDGDTWDEGCALAVPTAE
jgi:hypothetical protein